MNIQEKINRLHDIDNKEVYVVLQELEKISETTNDTYFGMATYLKMLDDEKSFIRVRGFRLICANAKWDRDNIIEKNIDVILAELDDEKLTSVRQCLKALRNIVKYIPVLNSKIKKKLKKMQLIEYTDTMKNLIYKDIQEVLDEMK